MTSYFLHYIVTFLIFIGIDLVWLGFIARKIYAEEMGGLMAQQVQWPAAILFYCIFVLGLLYFVIWPGVTQDSSWLKIGLSAAFFGFVTYATYDLTGLAVIEGWSLKLTLIDLAWGTTLALLVTAGSYAVAPYFSL